MSNLKLIYLILLFALFSGCNNSQVEQIQESTSNDIDQQLQELINNGCFHNGNPKVVSMNSTNPLKKYAIKIESTKTPGKFRYFFIDKTVGEMDDGVFRLLNGKWKCGAVSHNNGSDKQDEQEAESGNISNSNDAQLDASSNERQKQWVNCRECHGKGRKVCYSCNGTGQGECGSCNGTGTAYASSGPYTCNQCNGRGISRCSTCYGNPDEGNCINCDGRGQVQE